MIDRARKIWFWLLVVAVSTLTYGCGGGSSNNDSGSSGNEGTSAIVTVTDYSGIRMPNVTVVLGDHNGAMKTYGVTDADGQITFDNAPADATVTAAATCLRSGSTTTNHSIDIQFDVNASTVLSLDSCSASLSPLILPAMSSSPLGTITVNVTNTPGDVKQNQIAVGRQILLGFGSLITTQTITLREYDLDSDGAFSVMVLGRDANRNTIAYGFLLDQTFTNGMTVDIQMEPMSFIQYQISNIPATAVSFQPLISIYGAGQGFGSDLHQYPLLSTPSSTTIDVAFIPGLGSEVSYQIGVDLDQDHDGVADSSQSLSLLSFVGAPTNQSFDMSKALSAPHATVVGTDTATPTLSWSGIDPTATSIYITGSFRSSTADWYVNWSNLLRSRTSIRYPELPDSLAAFRPTKVDTFSVYTSASEGILHKSSIGSYQAPNP